MVYTPPIPQIGRYNKMYKQIHTLFIGSQYNTPNLHKRIIKCNLLWNIINYNIIIWYNFVKCSSTGCTKNILESRKKL